MPDASGAEEPRVDQHRQRQLGRTLALDELRARFRTFRFAVSVLRGVSPAAALRRLIARRIRVVPTPLSAF